MGEGKMAVLVSSAGCTAAEHFALEPTDAGGELTLTVVRKVPDNCRRMPFVIEIELTLPKQAGSAAFKVQNQFVNGPVWPPAP